MKNDVDPAPARRAAPRRDGDPAPHEVSTRNPRPPDAAQRAAEWRPPEETPQPPTTPPELPDEPQEAPDPRPAEVPPAPSRPDELPKEPPGERKG